MVRATSRGRIVRNAALGAGPLMRHGASLGPASVADVLGRVLAASVPAQRAVSGTGARTRCVECELLANLQLGCASSRSAARHPPVCWRAPAAAAAA